MTFKLSIMQLSCRLILVLASRFRRAALYSVAGVADPGLRGQRLRLQLGPVTGVIDLVLLSVFVPFWQLS